MTDLIVVKTERERKRERDRDRDRDRQTERQRESLFNIRMFHKIRNTSEEKPRNLLEIINAKESGIVSPF